MSEPRRYFSLAGPYAALAGIIVVTVVVFTVALGEWFPDAPVLAGAIALLVGLPLTLWLVRRQFGPMLSLFRALGGTVSSYRDGDFSFGLRWPQHDELGELVDAHNELGDVLREQRLGLVQRELLLDTMVQNTPVAMLLVAESGPVVYANIAARQLLNEGRKLEGHAIGTILERAAAPLRDAIDRGGDGLFSVGSEDEEEIYHLARRSFRLNGRAHELLLLRQITVELRRQEVK
ncbi:MAG: ATP-binding protein, partial [Arenimonas sp.]